MIQEFEILVETPSDLTDEAFDACLEALTENVWELGEEGALVGSSDGQISITVHIDRPTLSDALLYTLSYLKDKKVPVKAVTAPKND